ncbi:MAG: hypothetical protein QM737_08270 [Ferruginibacter sp.]
MKQTASLLLGIMIVAYSLISCKNDKAELLYPPDIIPCDSVNVTYSGTILPILRDNCYRCHAGNQTVAPFHLDSYADASFVALSGHMVGALTHSPGFSPMPKNADKLSDCTIGKIRKWIADGAPNN